MRKILICAGLLVMYASSAFADASETMVFTSTGLTLFGAKPGETASNASPLIAKTSTGVGLGILVETDGTGYAHVTQHKQGSKAYGTSFDSTAIYTIDVTVGTVKLGVPTATDTTDFGAWTAM